MSKYLPSKKFILIILSIILAIGIIFLFSWLGKNKKNPAELVNSVAKEKIQEFMVLDSDGDGMKDWEESLWKTDPQKMDTDNDGTNDGDEINLNRDPLVTNTAPASSEPNDKIDEKIIADQKKVEEDFNNLSETDKISRMLFSQYLATKKLGQTLTNADISNILNNSLSILPPLSFHQYTQSDLIIFDTTDDSQILDYKDRFAIAMSVFPREEIKPTFSDVINSLTEDDTNDQMQEKLNKLQNLITITHQAALNLLGVKTPTKYANAHLSIINALERISDNLLQITTSVDDPIKMFDLIKTYPDSLKNYTTAGYEFSVL